jgi:hypothetical protein
VTTIRHSISCGRQREAQHISRIPALSRVGGRPVRRAPRRVTLGTWRLACPSGNTTTVHQADTVATHARHRAAPAAGRLQIHRVAPPSRSNAESVPLLPAATSRRSPTRHAEASHRAATSGLDPPRTDAVAADRQARAPTPCRRTVAPSGSVPCSR